MKTKSNSLGEQQLEKLGEEKDEESEPATEGKREYTDLGLDLDKKKEQVTCHASALALAMTGEARWEARRKPCNLHCLRELQRKP